MITVVSLGTIGITESSKATTKMTARNHGSAESSLSSPISGVEMVEPIGENPERRQRASPQATGQARERQPGCGATDGWKPAIAIRIPISKIAPQSTYSLAIPSSSRLT